MVSSSPTLSLTHKHPHTHTESGREKHRACERNTDLSQPIGRKEKAKESARERRTKHTHNIHTHRVVDGHGVAVPRLSLAGLGAALDADAQLVHAARRSQRRKEQQQEKEERVDAEGHTSG